MPQNPEFSRWKPATCLRVTGEDAATFLQGQYTNNLQVAPASDGAVYGLWLNQKGKIVADSFVRRVAEREFWVASYFSPASAIRERLEAYVVADDVVIEDVTNDWAGLAWFGKAPPSWPEGAWTFAGRREAGGNIEVIYPVSAAAAMAPDLAGATELGAEELERRRLSSGIPAVPRDLGRSDLPNEGGLERSAISYTKGCYLGQEVMARLKSMGQVRRQLVRVRGSGAMPAGHTALYQDGKKVGDVRSAVADGAGWIGLAMVTLLGLRPNGALALAAELPPTVAWEEIS
ncbi:MAG: folate-binding protein [Verrucomicrobia bacterium]|nr:folate-binding protein [Verrucomicrobiota bacterium]